MGDLSKRFYMRVAGSDEEHVDYVPGTNEKVYIYEIGGNAALSPDTKVELVWDADGTPEVLFSTHGDAIHKTQILITGENSKVLRLKLTNDSESAETIGGYYSATEA